MTEMRQELDEAACLASLAVDDAERVAAYRRAESDPLLKRALDEGEQLMSLLASWTVPPPAEETLQRVASAVLAEMNTETVPSQVAAAAPTRRTSAAVRALIAAPVILAWAAVLVLSSKLFAADPRLAWSAVFALAALGATLGVLRNGRGVAVALTTVAMGLAALIGEPGVAHPSMACVHCLMVTIACAALAVVTTALLALGGKLRGLNASAMLAGVAAAGALAGAAALELTCANHLMGHLLVFHAGGIGLSALLGSAAGRLPQMRHAFAAQQTAR